MGRGVHPRLSFQQNSESKGIAYFEFMDLNLIFTVFHMHLTLNQTS
jgi:hypothetical protein